MQAIDLVKREGDSVSESRRVDPYLHSALSGKEQDLGAAEPPRTCV